MINVKFDATNSGAVGSLTLNVNGTGAKSIKYIYNNERNNIPAAGYLLKDNMYTFRYDGTYWVAQLMYNTNTTTGYGYYDYYFRACAGTSAIYRYKIVGMGEDNRLYPIVTTNQTSATQVAKAVQTTGIKPGHLWIYYSTTTASAGGAIAAATLLAGGGANTVGAYSFNESIPTYRTIYLRGTYDREKDLFYLYDDGTTPCKSYYTFVPTNSAVTLSDYFVEGNYYMIVGGSYSSENYFSIFADNPLYYFDGTNLIPVSTKVAKDEITSMVGTDEQEDNSPYSFRKTANGKISGSPVAAYDTIVGGSVVWNQLMKASGSGGIRETRTVDGITFTNNGDGSFTLNGTAEQATEINISSSIQYPKSHKFFIYNSGFSNRGNNTDYITTIGQRIDGGGIHRNGTTYNTSILRIVIANGSTYNNVKIYPIVIDLTAALGSTIADYVYSLETATAGAGVAWFRKYFPKEYYAYAEPHFEHVQTSAKETVGFNQWDEEWELGQFSNQTGEPIAATDCIRSKNFIDVLPNVAYANNVYGGTMQLFFYDSDKSYIGNYWVSTTVTSPSNARYMKFRMASSYGTTYNHDICINIHGDRDGEYEAYRKRTYPIEPKVLRGILKLDASNRPYFDGDIYRHDGSGEQRYYEADLGSLNWVASTNFFYAVLPKDAKTNTYNIVNTAGYQRCVQPNGSDIANGTTDKAIGVASTGVGGAKNRVYVRDTTYTDANAFKTAMSGKYLLFDLDVPEPFTAEPFQSPMVVDPLGTEEFVDYGVEQGTRDVVIPVGHNTKYRSGVYGEVGLKADTSYVDELVSDIDNSIPDWAKAPTKPTYTASEVGLGNVGNFKAVSTVASQGLTDTEKANARANIGAGTSSLAIGTTSSTAAAGNHTHGNITNAGALQTTDVAIANGDKLVVTDSSNSSKIARTSVSFDGSTTTKALTPKGTFETFLQSHQSLAGYVPTSRTINSKALTSDITLTASDVGAIPANDILTVDKGGTGLSSLTSGSFLRANSDLSFGQRTPAQVLSDIGALAASKVGAANGVAPLNSSSKIDTAYLPSYVDDVIEGYYYNSKFYTTSAHTTEISGETGKIFVDLSTNKTYRYSGSAFVEVSQGSVVTISRNLTSGTKVGTITIDGTGTDLYAPSLDGYVPTSRTINSKALTGNITLTASDVGAATSGHTHTTTIASGGTSQINLAANTAYTLTAGGTSYVFKTPADSDTKNTAGSTDTSSEIYLVGATSQAANPQTYSHDTARVRANGRIVGSGYEFAVASAMGTTKATMVYDSTLEAIAFQFD